MARQSGFTLIEVVVVIALLGVLATLGLSRFAGGGPGFFDKLAAEDAVFTELQRARDESIQRLDIKQNGEIATSVIADLQGVLDERFGANQFEVNPDKVEFSYAENGAVHNLSASTLTVTVNSDGEAMTLCVATATGRTTKGDCPP